MIYVYRILKNIGFKVKFPMIIEVDNQGAVDSENNWRVVVITRHFEVGQYFSNRTEVTGTNFGYLCPGETNESDLFTKNLVGYDF